MWRQQPAITCILGAGLQACEVGSHHIQQLIILSKQPATVLEKEANRVSLRDRPIVGGERLFNAMPSQRSACIKVVSERVPGGRLRVC